MFDLLLVAGVCVTGFCFGALVVSIAAMCARDHIEIMRIRKG